MMEKLKGKKTYIVAGVVAATVFAHQAGIIDRTLYEAIMGILVALGFTALRSGLDNANDKLLNR